jgi:hypothetical protein
MRASLRGKWAQQNNPHSNSNNAILARLRGRLQSKNANNQTVTTGNLSESLTAQITNLTHWISIIANNTIIYQISAPDGWLAEYLGLELKYDSNLNISNARASGEYLPDCDTIGANVYSNERCYDYKGMDRDDWFSPISLDACDATTTDIPQDFTDFLDSFCNDIPNEYFKEEDEMKHAAEQNNLQILVFLLTFLAVYLIYRMNIARRERHANDEHNNAGDFAGEYRLLGDAEQAPRPAVLLVDGPAHDEESDDEADHEHDHTSNFQP